MSPPRLLLLASAPPSLFAPRPPSPFQIPMPRVRRRPRPRAPLDDRDLAAEVLYLHSLYRGDPPAPVPESDQSRAAGRRAIQRNRRGDGDTEEAISDRDPVPSRCARRRPRKRGRRGLERDAAETQDVGSEWPFAPSSPIADETWPEPDGPSSSKPPPQPPSPGSLAHREALRAAAEFFGNHGSDDGDEEEEVSDAEGDEEEAAGFFTALFERDAALRGHYERSWEEGQFACLACASRKARRGNARRFRGCVGLVQHARAATRYGRPGAHRALATVVCRVLGWDIERLPSIVIDPRGTLGQELTARAQADVQEAKEDVETEMKSSDANGDEMATELMTTKEAAGMIDVEEIAPLNCEDSSKNNVYGHETVQEEVAVKTGAEEPISIGGEEEATGLDGHKESSETRVNDTVSELKHGKTADGIGDAAFTVLVNNPMEGNVDENKEQANLLS